jgi:hypothetical protein
MPESAGDVIAVLMGLIVLWFLLGSLLDEERFWRRHQRHGGQPSTGGPHGRRERRGYAGAQAT